MTTAQIAELGRARIADNRKRQEDRRVDVAARLARVSFLEEENRRFRTLIESQQREIDQLRGRRTEDEGPRCSGALRDTAGGGTAPTEQRQASPSLTTPRHG
jgi:hypothetical protein